MGEDKELKKVCQEIYRKHKAVLDTIYNYRPDNVQNVSDIVAEWCVDKEKAGVIAFSPYAANQSKCYRRFRCSTMDAIVDMGVENRQSGWKGCNQYFYEIEIKENGNGDVTYYLKLTFCCDNLSGEQKDKLSAIYNVLEGKKAGAWKTFKSVPGAQKRTVKDADSAIEDYDAFKKEIFADLDEMWNELYKKITKIAKQ